MVHRVHLALIAAACGPVEATDAPTGGPALVATTATDTYDAGILAVIGLLDHVPVEAATVHGDAVVSAEGGVVWQVNRLQMDTVRRYDPGDWTAPVWEASTGRASNPHDAAPCGDRLAVTRYESASILLLDPTTGDEVGTIDLSEHADADGLPEASDLASIGGRVFAGLQRLDRTAQWTPSPEGVVVELDCATATIAASWPTPPNPVLVQGPAGIGIVHDDGLSWFDGTTVAPSSLSHVDGAPLVDAAISEAGIALIARDGSDHVLACAASLDAQLVVHSRIANFASDVAIDPEGTAWFALRRGWEDPDDPGGLLPVALEHCTAAGPIVHTRLPPFSVAITQVAPAP